MTAREEFVVSVGIALGMSTRTLTEESVLTMLGCRDYVFMANRAKLDPDTMTIRQIGRLCRDIIARATKTRERFGQLTAEVYSDRSRVA
jgi:hypothetical protein